MMDRHVVALCPRKSVMFDEIKERVSEDSDYKLHILFSRVYNNHEHVSTIYDYLGFIVMIKPRPVTSNMASNIFHVTNWVK